MTRDDEVMISLGLKPSTPKRQRKGCGTYSRYMVCRKRPEGACEFCLAAKAKYSRENRAANGGRHTTPCRCKRGAK
jgi:hypothetical protein